MTVEPVVLLIEDDAQIRRFLRNSLEPQGFRLIEATTAGEGLALAAQYVPDLVILDLGLPDADGIDTITRLRAWSQLPILVLSARTSERQKVEALERGADDYLTKPFGFPELLARMRVALRRQSLRDAAADATAFETGPLRVDLAQRRVALAGKEVHLSPLEYRLLLVLVRHAGRVITHQQLLAAVWGPNSASHQHSLRVYMAHLRRKLEPEGGARLFQTEAGVGYRLRTN